MNHDPLVPPHSDGRQPENSPANAGHEWNNGITRRSFLKRTGGATLATMVTWNLCRQQVLAEGDGNAGDSGEKWGMLCWSPGTSGSPVPLLFTVDVPQAGGGLVPATISIEASTSKFYDPQGTEPYNSTSFSGTVSLDVIVGGAIVDFATYYADYSIECDEKNGNFNGVVTGRPWLVKRLRVTVGTSTLGINIVAIDPPLHGAMLVDTGIQIGMASIDADGVQYLFQLDPDTIKVRNILFPTVK